MFAVSYLFMNVPQKDVLTNGTTLSLAWRIREGMIYDREQNSPGVGKANGDSHYAQHSRERAGRMQERHRPYRSGGSKQRV
jgi:hypothetical protein